MTAAPWPPPMRLEEVAERLDVSVKAVRRLIHDGQLAAIYPDGRSSQSTKRAHGRLAAPRARHRKPKLAHRLVGSGQIEAPLNRHG
jgi:excisionase family DNA binding protein